MKTQKTALISIYVILLLLFLLACFRTCRRQDAETGSVEERAEEIGHDGRLKITLLWDFPGDIDLHVREPNGFEIYFEDKRDVRTGGFLDVDNRIGGVGSAENTYWETPPSGRYSVWLVYYSAPDNHRTGGPCTVIVKREVNGEVVRESFVVNAVSPNDRRKLPVTEFVVN